LPFLVKFFSLQNLHFMFIFNLNLESNYINIKKLSISGHSQKNNINIKKFLNKITYIKIIDN
jgi:hypothetical protein